MPCLKVLKARRRRVSGHDGSSVWCAFEVVRSACVCFLCPKERGSHGNSQLGFFFELGTKDFLSLGHAHLVGTSTSSSNAFCM